MSNVFGPLVGVGVLAFALRRTLRLMRLARESKTWPTVVGKVLRSRVRERSVLQSGYIAHVAYRYTVQGVDFESESVSHFPPGEYFTREDAMESITRYVTNEPVTVYYCPTEPSRAVLEPGIPALRRLEPFALVEMLVIAIVLTYLGVKDIALRP